MGNSFSRLNAKAMIGPIILLSLLFILIEMTLPSEKVVSTYAAVSTTTTSTAPAATTTTTVAAALPSEITRTTSVSIDLSVNSLDEILIREAFRVNSLESANRILANFPAGYWDWRHRERTDDLPGTLPPGYFPTALFCGTYEASFNQVIEFPEVPRPVDYAQLDETMESICGLSPIGAVNMIITDTLGMAACAQADASYSEAYGTSICQRSSSETACDPGTECKAIPMAYELVSSEVGLYSPPGELLDENGNVIAVIPLSGSCIYQFKCGCSCQECDE